MRLFIFKFLSQTSTNVFKILATTMPFAKIPPAASSANVLPVTPATRTTGAKMSTNAQRTCAETMQTARIFPARIDADARRDTAAMPTWRANEVCRTVW